MNIFNAESVKRKILILLGVIIGLLAMFMTYTAQGLTLFIN
jgi:hypothetical protein